MVAGLSSARGCRSKDPIALALASVAILAIVFAMLRTSTGFLEHTFGGNSSGGVPLSMLNAALLVMVGLLSAVIGAAVVARGGGSFSLFGLLLHAVSSPHLPCLLFPTHAYSHSIPPPVITSLASLCPCFALPCRPIPGGLEYALPPT